MRQILPPEIIFTTEEKEAKWAYSSDVNKLSPLKSLKGWSHLSLLLKYIKQYILSISRILGNISRAGYQLV